MRVEDGSNIQAVNLAVNALFGLCGRSPIAVSLEETIQINIIAT
jgi:hypothetical protein